MKHYFDKGLNGYDDVETKVEYDDVTKELSISTFSSKRLIAKNIKATKDYFEYEKIDWEGNATEVTTWLDGTNIDFNIANYDGLVDKGLSWMLRGSLPPTDTAIRPQCLAMSIALINTEIVLSEEEKAFLYKTFYNYQYERSGFSKDWGNFEYLKAVILIMCAKYMRAE